MPAGCTAEDLTTMIECSAAVTVPTATADTQAQCDYMKGTMACYPKCYCDDATFSQDLKDMADLSKAAFDILGVDCTLNCGTAAGLRATVFTGIVAALIAVFAAH
jgi:hypothetical protein